VHSVGMALSAAVAFLQRVGDGLLPGERVAGGEGALEGFVAESRAQFVEPSIVISALGGGHSGPDLLAERVGSSNQSCGSLGIATSLGQVRHFLEGFGSAAAVADFAEVVEALFQALPCRFAASLQAFNVSK